MVWYTFFQFSNLLWDHYEKKQGKSIPQFKLETNIEWLTSNHVIIIIRNGSFLFFTSYYFLCSANHTLAHLVWMAVNYNLYLLTITYMGVFGLWLSRLSIQTAGSIQTNDHLAERGGHCGCTRRGSILTQCL